jgi:hypothetical protein
MVMSIYVHEVGDDAMWGVDKMGGGVRLRKVE